MGRGTNNKMACRHCGCRQSIVVTTQTHEVTIYGQQKTIIKRYRKCRHCYLQFTTVETYESEVNTNAPDDTFYPSIPNVPKHDFDDRIKLLESDDDSPTSTTTTTTPPPIRSIDEQSNELSPSRGLREHIPPKETPGPRSKGKAKGGKGKTPKRKSKPKSQIKPKGPKNPYL